MDRKYFSDYIKILNKELVPALGCTEPIAIAFAAAKAASVLGEKPGRLIAKCSGNIIKNVIILSILEKGGVIVMRTLLIKILVIILLQIVIILIQEFWK